MRSVKNNKSGLIKSGLAASALLLASAAAFGQQTVNLSAAPATATLPDGTAVPMWGYSCGTVVTGSTATCTALNQAVAAAAAAGTPLTGVWSPVVITVPTGQDLQITLTNSLSFGSTPNNIPTSLVIVGQFGGGLGTAATSTASPDHTNAQPLTWPIAGDAPGAGLSGVGTPPVQGTRVQSFSTEVAVGTPGSLCWGVCGVTGRPALKPGTYLIESGTHPSIQGPMGLYGILVVTTAPGTTAGCAYPGATAATCAVSYNADIPVLLSEIDPVQNAAVNAAVRTTGFNESTVWSGAFGGCGNPWNANGTANTTTYGTCYPPAVNYTPLYYLINGTAFDKTSTAASLFPAAPPTGVAATGAVLVRLVNAGLRMHVPSIVGSQTGTAVAPALPPSGFALIAEDGNPLPGIPRVQSEVFMAAGKTYDVMINAPAAATTAATLPVYDRELSLSGNATARDAGMLAYISVNGGTLPSSPSIAAAVARADTYNSLIAGQKFTVLDSGKGVIANDTNVYGVHLLAPAANGTVTLNANGSFTYVPNSGSTATSDSFTYCANGSVTAGVCSSGLTATVTLGAGDTSSTVACSSTSYTANTAAYLAIKTPGVLASCTDSKSFPLTATAFTGAGVVEDASGGFTVSLATPCTTSTSCPTSFTFQAKSSQGILSSATTVNVTFPAASNLLVKVLDGADKTTEITDYRWIIEEDRTFYIDPKCTTNSSTAIPGCPPPPAPG